MSKKYGLDIFKTLRAIDKHDHTYLNKCSDDEQKSYFHNVVMRWTSSVEGPHSEWYLLAVNEKANMHGFDIYRHPELQYKLLASCGLGIVEKHKWISAKNNDKHQKTRDEFVEKYWPLANNLEKNIILGKLENTDVLNELLSGLGLQNDEVKQIRAAFK